MLLVVYDIQNDKIRTRFAKCLKAYGRRVQYSVFEIKNSPRILNNLCTDIEVKFERLFKQGDSVLIYNIGDTNCVAKYGYPSNEDDDLIIL